MENTKFNSVSKFLVFSLMMIFACSLFLLTACDGFEGATKLNVNAANTSDANMKYNAINVKAEEDVSVYWTIADNAKDNASSYNLVVLDKDKSALSANNKLTSVIVYDKDKKSLGTATTTTEGQYNLSAVLGDSKIAGGTYYAVLKFAKDGTYNIAIKLNA